MTSLVTRTREHIALRPAEKSQPLELGSSFDVSREQSRAKPMLEDVKVSLAAVRQIADELAPGEMEEVTATQMRAVVQMVTVLTEAVTAVIEELERLRPSE